VDADYLSVLQPAHLYLSPPATPQTPHTRVLIRRKGKEGRTAHQHAPGKRGDGHTCECVMEGDQHTVGLQKGGDWMRLKRRGAAATQYKRRSQQQEGRPRNHKCKGRILLVCTRLTASTGACTFVRAMGRFAATTASLAPERSTPRVQGELSSDRRGCQRVSERMGGTRVKSASPQHVATCACECESRPPDVFHQLSTLSSTSEAAAEGTRSANSPRASSVAASGLERIECSGI
jgi:hypothetical protein